MTFIYIVMEIDFRISNEIYYQGLCVLISVCSSNVSWHSM